MRQLSLMEINEVSGGDFWSSVGAMVLGCMTGLSAGVLKGATIGGNAGGILGAGIIGGLGGVVIAGIVGCLEGALYGMVNDWDKTLEWFNNTAEQWFDLVSPLPK
jgi:hypothetical protein